MTTKKPHDDQLDPQPEEQVGTDPLGPVKMPIRSRIGARAFALVGAASVLSIGMIETTDVYGVAFTPTISVD
ncbi:hypothetical protein [Kribbella sp. CA-294648]|uniref:hypothetical protein n=1 Tax=Kribbella sp. CA-294648 TaxID=3239948 RepID=UPI003D8FA2A7